MSTRSPQTSNFGAAGNTSRATSRTISEDPGGPIYKASTISFSGTTISDSATGLAKFASYVGNTIEVRGSASNNREYLVTAVAGDGSTITVAQALTTEAAGALVTILDGEC
ncbi:MAG: hypothetical protein P4L83_21115 [Nevskia sp.]|nr:hypothetical protein [Nevskia sp.]